MDTHVFDVLVIGAGIAGATAAAHLAATHRVALLEAEESAGYHATGRSAAIWIRNYGGADVRILTAASRGFFEAPPAGFAEASLARPRPVVHLAPADQVEHLRATIAEGDDMREISLDAVQAMAPVLRPGYAVMAAIESDCFDIDVAAMHQGFLRQTRLAGGVLALRSRAGRLWRENGTWHAETSTGAVFTAPTIVNAAGAWGDEVARLAGLAPIGLQPKRRTACIIDPGDHDCADWPLLGDAGHGWYVRPEARRKLMVSPADETDSDPCDAQPDEYDVAVAIDRMQQALDIPVSRIEHRWAGLRSFTPDRGLAIGQGAEAGFFWMVGQGGYGMQTAPAAGRLLAALVAQNDPGALAAAVPLCDPMRFARSAAA
ncbi:NAD(P)/FAD-dependent oxidoreductase [Neoroseomonas lacus]|uniref:FAD-dependent catabolic D-arginine dehydrogenase DauA n=1 Tax=Neoroseomonas lacus TaxID=287609 RepID=A0A917KYR0_9PROT|nr:FAD-binding oxidoreductase [Neoroseomonas lacus]GGJ34152.1 FAD-dependent catabolic D-arginine dehydrogenase DauA [Neoroseomonas lacus]